MVVTAYPESAEDVLDQKYGYAYAEAGSAPELEV